MDYKTSDEDRDLKTVTRQLLESYAAVDKRLAEKGHLSGKDQELAIGRFAQDGWLEMLGARADSTPARMVTAVHAAKSFGAVPTVALAPVILGFLAPLTAEIGAAALDHLTETVSSSAVTCSVPRSTTFGQPAGTVLSRGPHSAMIHLEDDVRDVLGPCGSGAIAVPVADDRGITVALIDYTSFDPETVESVSSGVDISSDAMTIHCAGLEVPGRVLGSSLSPPRWSSALSWARDCYRLWLSSQAVGGSEEIARRTVSHLSSREQFGRPLAAFQALRHQVADIETAAQNASAITFDAAWRLGEGSPGAGEWVAAAWLYTARSYREVCEVAIQCHGGMGFTWEGAIHLWWRTRSGPRSTWSLRSK